MVPLTTRHLLPWGVAVAWVLGTLAFAFPKETMLVFSGSAEAGDLFDRSSEWEVLNWFASMLAVMVVVDRLYCRWLVGRVGVDPMEVHWTELRNRNGDFMCAHCLSVFMLPPPDLDEEKMVTCGDCGAGKARYGDMKPHLNPMPDWL
jgi:hypothetical protein